MRPPHHVAAGRQRAKRGAMIRLPPSDNLGSGGLTDLQEILPRQLDRRLGPLGPRGAEPGTAQAPRFRVQDDRRQILGRLVGERAGVRIGHRSRLPPDRLGHPAVAMTEACDRRPTRGIDDRPPVRGVQIDPLATCRDRRDGARTVQDAGHAACSLTNLGRWSCTVVSVRPPLRRRQMFDPRRHLLRQQPQ